MPTSATKLKPLDAMPPEELPLLELFIQLRECGLPLGIGEYQLVLKAWQAGYGTTDRNSLKRLCRTVWVKSPEDAQLFEVQFNRLVQQLPRRLTTKSLPDPSNRLESDGLSKNLRQPDIEYPKEPSRRQSFDFRTNILIIIGILITTGGGLLAVVFWLGTIPKDFRSDLTRLPLQISNHSAALYESASQSGEQAPEPTPIPRRQRDIVMLFALLLSLGILSVGSAWWWYSRFSKVKRQPQTQTYSSSHSDISMVLTMYIQDEVQIVRQNQTLFTEDYLPVTRRQMKQSWRYLRRMVRSGPPIELDMQATVNDIGRQGILLAPLFRPRRVNQAEVLLLIDQEGSMVPFHGLSQRLVETVRRGGRLTQAKVYYFHNCPVRVLFHDPYCQSADTVDQVIQAIASDYAGVLVVSDGGAAHGRWNPNRLALTEQFLAQMSRRVRYFAWLNPMPRDRWSGTTAGAIASQVPMFEFNRTGLDQAIGVLRGQLRNYR